MSGKLCHKFYATLVFTFFYQHKFTPKTFFKGLAPRIPQRLYDKDKNVSFRFAQPSFLFEL